MRIQPTNQSVSPATYNKSNKIYDGLLAGDKMLIYSMSCHLQYLAVQEEKHFISNDDGEFFLDSFINYHNTIQMK